MFPTSPAFFQEASSEPFRLALPESVARLFDDSRYGPALTWAAVLLAAWLANWLAKKVLLRAVRHLVGKTRAQWDDVLVEYKVFERLSVLAPALVLYLAAPLLFGGEGQERWASYVQRFANVWMVLAAARAGSALLDALASVGMRHESTRDKPVRSYAQVVKLVLWLAVGIIAVATLMQKSPWALLTGLGAMTAILLLVFKDSILGFVASVRIAANDMVRTGDWIEMPKYGADGDVVEINLHTVKVQNWDKTITMIPTHAFMSDSFKNWRGMTESGGRRIKRSVALDMTSVRFLSEEELERLRDIELLSGYLSERCAEVDAWNQERGVSKQNLANGRALTNLGTFRAYLSRYLKKNEFLRDDMTFLVRYLSPGPEGLPIEIYVFSAEQRWVHYEGLLGDILDHVLAVIPLFGLRVFQSPSGSDVRSALESTATRDEPSSQRDSQKGSL